LVPFQYNRYETLQRGHNAGELLDPPQGQFDGGVNALPLERIAALDQSHPGTINVSRARRFFNEQSIS
jgi:hypothetical protein